MSLVRIALAQLRPAASRDESVELAARAIDEAAAGGARLVVFPECYVPGYRTAGDGAPPPDAAFLARAWAKLGERCARGGIVAAVGTERLDGGELRASVVVIDERGEIQGFQDKVQIDPSEEGTYVPASGRRVFRAADLVFGVVICHEGWRYPETVRWAARHGAELVVHPHFHVAEPGAYVPSTFADPKNTFHEKAMLCRAAESTIWFASVNAAIAAAPTTSAVVAPDGSLVAHVPYGAHALLFADVDRARATRLLASRLRDCKEA